MMVVMGPQEEGCEARTVNTQSLLAAYCVVGIGHGLRDRTFVVSNWR